MALNYHKNDRLNKILTLQDAYMLWYSVFLRHASAQDIKGIQAQGKLPLFLEDFADTFVDLFSPEELEAFNQSNITLFKYAQDLIQAFQGKDQKKKHSLYLQFMEKFEVFLEEIKAMRSAVFYKERGFDQFSSLKNKKTMFQDFFLEMERLSRQGTPFAMALAKIDDYEDMKSAQGDEQAKAYLKLAAQGFIENLRPFDDAYYTGENEFVLCLKQTNLSGGMRAFQRFEDYLESVQEKHSADKEKTPLTMSCCIAEIVVSDDIGELLDNLRNDITTVQRAPGAVFSYQEVSPLQRYVKSK